MPAKRTPLAGCLPRSQGQKKRSVRYAPKGISKPGRPTVKIDLALVAEFAKLHCTNKEIAAKLHIDVKTLDKHCSELIRETRMSGKGDLRKWLWKAAETGDTKAMIWLSKQHLGMKDKQDINTTSETTTVKILHGVSMEDL